MKAILTCILCLAANLYADEFLIEGTWKAVTTLPEGEDRPSTLVITNKEGKLEGVASTSNGEKPIKEISVGEDAITFAIDLEYEGTPFTFKVSSKSDGNDTLKGTWAAEGEDGNTLASGDWKADREAVEANPLVGDWKALATDPDSNELKFDVNFAEADGKLSGTMKTDDGSLTMKSVKLEDDKATITVGFPYDSQIYPVTITATLKGDKLDGKWVAEESDGTEAAAGDWSAVRVGAPTVEGAWDIVGTLPDGGEAKSVYHIEAGDDGKWKGKSVAEAGEVVFDKVSVEDDVLTVDMELPNEGSSVELRVKLALSKDGNGLKGDWIAFDESGQEAAKGAVKGARKTDS